MHGTGQGNMAARKELETILREIEIELTEQGYTGDGTANP
jgi:hypothetical protein